MVWGYLAAVRIGTERVALVQFSNCNGTEQLNNEQFQTQTASKTEVFLARLCIQQSIIFTNSEL